APQLSHRRIRLHFRDHLPVCIASSHIFGQSKQAGADLSFQSHESGIRPGPKPPTLLNSNSQGRMSPPRRAWPARRFRHGRTEFTMRLVSRFGALLVVLMAFWVNAAMAASTTIVISE